MTDALLFLTGWLLVACALGCVIGSFIKAGQRKDRGSARHSVHNGQAISAEGRKDHGAQH